MEKDLENITCDALLNEAGLPHRAETMRVYFTMHANDLMNTFESLPKDTRGGQSDPQMRARIVDAVEEGLDF